MRPSAASTRPTSGSAMSQPESARTPTGRSWPADAPARGLEEELRPLRLVDAVVDAGLGRFLDARVARALVGHARAPHLLAFDGREDSVRLAGQGPSAGPSRRSAARSAPLASRSSSRTLLASSSTDPRRCCRARDAGRRRWRSGRGQATVMGTAVYRVHPVSSPDGRTDGRRAPIGISERRPHA